MFFEIGFLNLTINTTCQYLFLFTFLRIATSVEWLYFFPIAKDIEYFSKYVLAICGFSFES